MPSRSGVELINRLRQAVENSGVPIICESSCKTLFVEPDGRIAGVEMIRKDNAHETIACETLILACSGYGGNSELVRRYIPEMADALYFGHPGNHGDAVIWGEALGAKISHLAAYQGHGSVAVPYNILITWAVIMEGEIQINLEGRRFCNEALGYSEQAAEVLRQRDAVVWNVFNSRIASIARQFEDFRLAEKARAILTGQTIEELAAAMEISAANLTVELSTVEELKTKNGYDRFGRQFAFEQAAFYSLSCRKSYRGAISYSRRPCRRCHRARQTRKRENIPQPICCWRRRRRCVRPHCGGLSIRQRPPDCDGARPSGRASGSFFTKAQAR